MVVCGIRKPVMEDSSEELNEHMARDYKFDDALNRYIFSAHVLLL